MVSRFRVGVIAGTHGLRGEVKVFPTTDEPARFLDLEKVILDTGREERTLTIRSVKFFKKFVILGFKGMDRIEDVEKLKGAELLINREDAIPLEEGEYFIPDLLGLRVVTDDGRELGVIKDVIETGANNVYDVQNEDGARILIPAIPQCILDVRLEEGDMTVHLLPGLENLGYEIPCTYTVSRDDRTGARHEHHRKGDAEGPCRTAGREHPRLCRKQAQKGG